MAVINVVKFDGVSDRRWIIYKYPGHEFYTHSKLIVGIGQVAVTIHGGKVENGD